MSGAHVKLIYQKVYEIEVDEAESIDEAVTKAHEKLQSFDMHGKLREQDIKDAVVTLYQDNMVCSYDVRCNWTASREALAALHDDVTQDLSEAPPKRKKTLVQMIREVEE